MEMNKLSMKLYGSKVTNSREKKTFYQKKIKVKKSNKKESLLYLKYMQDCAFTPNFPQNENNTNQNTKK